MLRSLVPALALSSLLCGCLPSLNPLSSKSEAFPEGLADVWDSVNDNNKAVYNVSLERGRYSIKLTPLDNSLSGKPICWDMTISKIGESLYANIVLSRETYERWPEEAKDYASCYVIPYYCIFKLELKGDELSLLPWDDSVENLPLPQKLDNSDGRPGIFTASQAEMREWIAKHSGKFFTERGKLLFKRKPAQGSK